MCVRLERSAHLACSRNRTVYMNATRRFSHSGSIYVRKKAVRAYIELVILEGFIGPSFGRDWTISTAFSNFPLDMVVQRRSLRLSDADNQSMVGRCKAQPEVTRSEIVNQSFSNARTSHPSYDDPKNPTPSMHKTNAFCFFQGEERRCVNDESARRNETDNTCALIRPPQTTRKAALAPRRVCDSRGPGAATSARSLSIILQAVVPASVYGAVLLGTSSRPRASLYCAPVCFLTLSLSPLHHLWASEQSARPACRLVCCRPKSVKGLPPHPGSW
jgi:hypothetical protein